MPSGSLTEIRRYFDNLTGYLLVTDSHAHILYASKSLEKSSGFLMKEIIGKTPGRLWGGNMSKDFYKNMSETLAIKKMPFVGEVNNKKKNSIGMMETLHIQPILDKKGKVIYYIAVQPKFTTKKQADAFKKEFVAFMKDKKKRPSEFMQQVLTWLSSKHKTTKLFKQYDHEELSMLLGRIFVSEGDKLQIENEQLILDAQTDMKNYGALYEKYRPKILNYFLHHLGGDSVLAEDLTEETFSKALSQLSHFTITHTSYFSYLLAAAHNILVNYYRSSKTISLEKLPHLSIEENHPMIRKIEFALVWQYIESLPLLEQQILAMKYKDDLAIAEIGRKIGKSENAVKLHLSRARRKLRKQIITP